MSRTIGSLRTWLIIMWVIATFLYATAVHNQGKYENISKQYDTLFTQNNNLDIKYKTLDIMHATLVDENAELRSENTKLNQELRDMEIRIKQLETIQKQVSRGAVGTSRHILADVSAYDADRACTGKTDGITASDTKAKVWQTVAMANVPFGTHVYIPYFKDEQNRGMFVVEDRGGAVSGDRIDIFVDTHNHAKEIGRHKLDAYIMN